MKICSKCKIEKDLSEFHKRNMSIDGYAYICKKCRKKLDKIYRNENLKKVAELKRKYYIKNQIEILKKATEWRKNNSEYNKKYYKKWYEKNNKNIIKQVNEYRKSKANYNTYAPQISYADEVRNINDFLQVKCAYCGKWCFPTNQEIRSRIKALNGRRNRKGAESRLYCSIECKQACPIYNQRLYSKLDENNQTREVQPELRQMVFERDNYICLKCKRHQNNLNVPLHCHHTEGILWNPLESADIDQCMTVCKDCHKEIHQQEDCGYHDLQCKKAA